MDIKVLKKLKEKFNLSNDDIEIGKASYPVSHYEEVPTDNWWYIEEKGCLLPKIINGKFEGGRYIESNMLKNAFNILYTNGFRAVDFTMYGNSVDEYDVDYDDNTGEYPMEDGEIIFKFIDKNNNILEISAIGDFDYMYEDDDVEFHIFYNPVTRFRTDFSVADQPVTRFRTDFSVADQLFSELNQDEKSKVKIIGSYCFNEKFNDIDIVCCDPLIAFKIKKKSLKDNIKIQLILRNQEDFKNIENQMTFKNDCVAYYPDQNKIIVSPVFKDSLILETNDAGLEQFKNYLTIEKEIIKKLNKGYSL